MVRTQTYRCWDRYPGLPILLEDDTVQSMNDFILDHGTEYTLQGIVNTNITNHKLIIKDFLHPV